MVAVDPFLLLGNTLPMESMKELIKYITTDQSSSMVPVNGVFSFGNFGKLKLVTGQTQVEETHKVMAGVKLILTVLKISALSGDIINLVVLVYFNV